MKLVAPDYYSRFQCTAEKCTHNCCIGWEIDIDPDTCGFYRTVEGELGQELARCIDFGEEPHFRLGEDERCPFLDENNLCRIISELGHEALCDICADHPRFRNHFAARTEIGLGMCCEAAAELIVNNPSKVTLVTLEDDGSTDEEKDAFFAVREEIFSIAQNRHMTAADRMDLLCSRFGAALPHRSPAAWAELYAGLERLDPEWDCCLDRLSAQAELPSVLSDLQLEQLICYFIFRHLSGSTFEGTFGERLGFCLLSVKLIDAVCAASGRECADIARMYSAEIEYSDENIQAILSCLS